MQLDLGDQAFRSMINNWLRSLDDEIITDLVAVFDQSPGVYPTTLLELWREELEHRQLTARVVASPAYDVSADDNLPVGHPVDADWRFTPESAVELAQVALTDVLVGEPVAHIGTPSTFLRCALSDTQHQHVLLDRNVAVLDALAADIRSPHIMFGVDLAAIGRLHLSAGAAIVDPPWYLDETLLFLAVAAEVCRTDATVVLCQPAVGARPGVEVERKTLLERVPTLGLDLHALRSGAVRYATPHFEAVSLRAAARGASIPTSWRRGDMLLLKRTSHPRLVRHHTTLDRQWTEVSFGPVRIKLMLQPTGHDLGSLVPGNVLTTVSRRDPLRERIGLWTSGNRIFTLANPLLIGQLARLCEIDLMSDHFSLSRTLSHAAQLDLDSEVAAKLFAVLLTELQEHQQGGQRNASDRSARQSD